MNEGQRQTRSISLLPPSRQPLVVAPKTCPDPEIRLAARILPFRSLVPAVKPVMFSPVSGPLYPAYSSNSSSKVLTMTNNARRHKQLQAVESQGLFRKLEQEIQDGYMEVEITGLTLPRLIAAYAILARNAWHAGLDNVRALWRPTPAL